MPAGKGPLPPGKGSLCAQADGDCEGAGWSPFSPTSCPEAHAFWGKLEDNACTLAEDTDEGHHSGWVKAPALPLEPPLTRPHLTNPTADRPTHTVRTRCQSICTVLLPSPLCSPMREIQSLPALTQEGMAQKGHRAKSWAWWPLSPIARQGLMMYPRQRTVVVWGAPPAVLRAYFWPCPGFTPGSFRDRIQVD